MAQSNLPFDGTTATAAPQSSPAAVAGIQPFDNTDTFTVYNKSASVGILVKIRTAPVAVANDPNESVYIPPASAMTLPLGDTSHRPPYGTAAGQTTIYYSSDHAVDSAEIAITYLNNIEL
jgi:hypothetical protein